MRLPLRLWMCWSGRSTASSSAAATGEWKTWISPVPGSVTRTAPSTSVSQEPAPAALLPPGDACTGHQEQFAGPSPTRATDADGSAGFGLRDGPAGLGHLDLAGRHQPPGRPAGRFHQGSPALVVTFVCLARGVGRTDRSGSRTSLQQAHDDLLQPLSEIPIRLRHAIQCGTVRSRTTTASPQSSPCCRDRTSSPGARPGEPREIAETISRLLSTALCEGRRAHRRRPGDGPGSRDAGVRLPCRAPPRRGARHSWCHGGNGSGVPGQCARRRRPHPGDHQRCRGAAVLNRKD